MLEMQCKKWFLIKEIYIEKLKTWSFTKIWTILIIKTSIETKINVTTNLKLSDTNFINKNLSDFSKF